MSDASSQTFYFQELSDLTGIKPYVIRFWETEFTEINPTITASGEKIYSSLDVEILLKIKKFLFEDKLTIHQAKLSLQTQNQHEEKEFNTNVMINNKKLVLKNALGEIREFKLKYQW